MGKRTIRVIIPKTTVNVSKDTVERLKRLRKTNIDNPRGIETLEQVIIRGLEKLESE